MRRIFGGGRDKVERTSVEDLGKRLTELRNEKLMSSKNALRSAIGEIIGCRDEILGSLDELGGLKPSSEIHSGLLKAGESGRKLLIDKIRRALSVLRPPHEISAEALRDFEKGLVKSVNLTTDAMIVHGRYVGAVFEKDFAKLRLRLERMQYLVRQVHELGRGLLAEVERIDSLSLKVSSALSARTTLAEQKKRLAELEAEVSAVDSKIAEETKKLEELINSEEYAAEVGIRAEAEAVEGELKKFMNEVSAAFSEIARLLRKASKLVDSGTYPIDKEKAKVLKMCMENPVDLFSDINHVSLARELLTDISKLIDERKIELEEIDRKKKLNKVRRLASALDVMKSDYDALLIKSGRYSGREHPVEKAEQAIEQNIRDLKGKKDKMTGEIEALRDAIKKAEEGYSRALQDIASASASIFGKAIELTS